MDRRASLGGQRPAPPQRAVSGGSYGLSHPAPKRPALPSGLSHMRSVSQPVNVVDLTSDGTTVAQNNVAAFVGTGEAVVTSPDVIHLEDDIEEPPAKRAKVSGEDFKAEAIAEAHYEIPIPLGTPLPSPPSINKPASRSVREAEAQSSIDPVSRKAHGIDPPATATRLPPPKKAADFSPWTGNHAEDVLNEQVIKNGYMDKAQGANQAESNSAKAAMSSGINMKNSPGLGLLGWMFAGALEKRQLIGTITAPSAFKPPPRVTVTDTKREAWLRDLANPEVPLRKQSRTIPHGIRGKLLMEQCLSKDIPLQRAVWLAKCVGANELRAFRRKGVSGSATASGESKWVREWTVHVEQFLEDVVASCGQEGWKERMNYAVKLSTAFYSERLLEAEHWLDWIVSSLANASLERLPIWIILTQLYWKDIVTFGRRGRRLAEGILEHLDGITKSGAAAFNTLKLRLQKLLAVLAASNRECLIIPRTWQKYKHLLTPTDANARRTPAANIKKRNERLVGPTLKTATNTRSPLLDLFDGLDSITIDTDLDDLARKSLQLVPDVAQLAAAVLDWASTQYRTGISRIYVSATIIANLHSTGQDTDSAILRHLQQATDLDESSIDLVHRVILELYRRQAFSISRYFQWLLVSGASLARGGSLCAIRLITAFATSVLPPHLQNTRNTLMKRLGIALDDTTAAESILRNIDEALAHEDMAQFDPVELPQELSLATKHAICQQVSIKVATMAKDIGIGLHAFSVCRDVVERLQDVWSLASTVMAAVTTNNSALLATVVDTINLHADSFAALGALKRLSDAVTEQYSLLRSQQPLERTLILALTNLTRRIPDKAAYVKMLEQDLVMCDQQYSAIVCSPASDSLIGMHASNIDSDEDIDAVFASGNTMDEQLMQRVFVRIMQRTLKSTAAEPGTGERISSWMNQLRSVEGSGGTFENILQNHIRTIMASGAGNSFPMASLIHLVVSSCLTLGSIADIAKEISLPQTAADVLPLFTSVTITEGFGLDAIESYRFRLYQSRCKEQHAEALATILRTACVENHLDPTNVDLITFVIWSISAKPEIADVILTDGRASGQAHQAVGSSFNAILNRSHARKDTDMEVDMDIRQIISQANPLSIRHSVAALKCLRSAPSVNELEDDQLADMLIQTFKDGSSVWPQLLEFADEDVIGKAHLFAKEMLVQAVTGEAGSEVTMSQNDIARHLDLLSVTTSLANFAEDTDAIAMVTDVFGYLDNALLQTEDLDEGSRALSDTIAARLRLALDLCVLLIRIHSDDDEATQEAESNHLLALCALLVHSSLQSNMDLIEYIYDLASTIADRLSDAAFISVQQEASSLLPNDTRITSILGTAEDPLDSWLLLESKAEPTGSQQQRALNKHVPQPQQQSPGRSSPQGSGHQSVHPPHQRVPSFGYANLYRQDGRTQEEKKYTSFHLNTWEIMPEVSGDNNTSLDLKLFGARKV